MKIPLRDLRSLPVDQLLGKFRYALERRAGRAPEHTTARRIRTTSAEDGPNGSRVLIFTPRDWAFHVQVESVIGLALEERGASITVLGCGGGLEVCDHNNCYRAPPMPCGSCVQYSRDAASSHGFQRVELQYDSSSSWPELDRLSVDELYEVEWQGFPLGALALVPTQWFSMTTRVQNDPLAASTIRMFLRSGRRVLEAMERQVGVDVDVVLMLNGTFFFEAILAELCRRRGTDFVTYERGFVDGTLVFRRNEPACYYDQGRWWSSLNREPLDEPQQERLASFLVARRTGGETLDRYWQNVRFEGVKRQRRGALAVMFTNLTWDSAVIGRHAAFPSIHEWIETTIEAFSRRPDDELIIRVHPAEAKLRGKATREPVAKLIQSRFPNLPDNVRVVPATDPTSSYTLMEQADVGLVYTSTTGLELALAGTPVLVAGKPHYRDKGFTLDAHDVPEFLKLLGSVLDDPAGHAPDVELARRYGWLFFFGSPFDFPFVKERYEGVPDLRIRRRSDLAPGHNVDLDRLCDDLLGSGDFGPPQRGAH